MKRTLILYDSESDFSEQIAKKLSLILGPAIYCSTSRFRGQWENYEFILLCVPVYSESVNRKLLDYVAENAYSLNTKKVILIGACLSENVADQWPEPFEIQLGDVVLFSSLLHGGMDELVALALEIKKIRDESGKRMEHRMLREYADQFIKSHNTCALATGYGNHVRATPIEYSYINGFLYILSEGGVKFANILVNPNVSLCIFDNYRSMNELGGMQITGSSEIIDTGSEEYLSVLQQKGLNIDKIRSFPITLNLIKITIQKIEFLWSEFSRLGYEVKQIIE